jgi:hypothetical protein
MVHAPKCTINRYYDPATGQFVSVDPMANETNQPYLYAEDDPVNGVDPSGMDDVNLGEQGAAAMADYCHAHSSYCQYGDPSDDTFLAAVGLVLGVAGVATGVGAIIEGSVLLVGVATIGAGAGTAIDLPECRNHNELGCVGLIANGIGFISTGPAQQRSRWALSRRACYSQDLASILDWGASPQTSLDYS